MDTGGAEPVFRVCEKNHTDAIFEGSKPSTPWILVCRTIQEKAVRGTSPITVSGPEYFGLAHPKVREWLSALPNAERCRNFQMVERTAEPSPSESDSSEDEENGRKAKTQKSTIVDFGRLLANARRNKGILPEDQNPS